MQAGPEVVTAVSRNAGTESSHAHAVVVRGEYQKKGSPSRLSLSVVRHCFALFCALISIPYLHHPGLNETFSHESDNERRSLFPSTDSSVSQGIEETKKMVISYDNLITRLWLCGAIEPFRYHPSAKTAHSSKRDETPVTPVTVEPLIDLLSGTDDTGTKTADSSTTPNVELETFINEDGLPPVPHEYWVERLGFQQPDPVTDFRSGGVLSLAMMVYMVESKPVICQRFFTGDTAVLPFGITCINVTDMIAKFLMLAKSTDRMDALLSQKPFWKMFGDPNAILAVQEIAMSMLCDVAAELGQEKKVPALAKLYSDGMPGHASDKVRLVRF